MAAGAQHIGMHQPAGAAPAREDMTVLFVVGAQKAGTTWLADYLRGHPECHVPPVKEMHYFDILFDPGAQGFLDQRRRVAARPLPLRLAAGLRHRLFGPRPRPAGRFVFPSRNYAAALLRMHQTPSPDHALYWDMLTDGAGDARCVADVTPGYATLGPDAFAEMLRAFPTARFLCVLRDPVSRTWSALRMRRKAGRRRRGAAAPGDLLARYLDGRDRDTRRRSDYRALLAALDKAVPAERVLHLFYEELFTEAAIRRLTEFLGIGYHPARFDAVVHRGAPEKLAEPGRAALRRDLADVYDAMKRRFGDRLPREWHAHDALVGG